MQKVNFAQYSEIVVLTGAGISVASGIKPYRGPDGLFEGADGYEYPTVETLDKNPSLIWKQYGAMRYEISQAEPNIAHLTLTKIEEQLSDNKKFTLITQNIDGLHRKSGSKNLVELHGNIFKTRCRNKKCTLTPFYDLNSYNDTLPYCPECGSVLRPDIVLFNESLPVKEEWLSKKALRSCDLFIAIGTSGTVSPASYFVRSAEYAGARTILINLTEMKPHNPAFKEQYLGKAEEIVPELFGLSV